MSNETETGQNTQSNSTEEKSPAPKNDSVSEAEDRSKNNDTVDYKGLYEEEKTRRTRAENKIVKQKKKYQSDSDDEDGRNFDVDDIVSRVTEQTRSEMRVDSLISQYTSDEGEQKKVRDSLNDINPTGDIEKDVRRAVLIANEENEFALSRNKQAEINADFSRTDANVSGNKPLFQKVDGDADEVKVLTKRFEAKLPPRYQNMRDE